MEKEWKIRLFKAPDASMEPAIMQNAQIYCTASMEAQAMDYIVLLRQNASFPLIRRYIPEADGRILLKALNRDFASYYTNPAELAASGELFVLLRAENEFPALRRTDESFCFLSPQKDHTPTLLVKPEKPVREYLTFEEAQALLKVKRTRMYALLQSGELEASKLGKFWRIERAAIERYFAAKTFHIAKKE